MSMPEFIVWDYIPEDDSCGACGALTGLHTDKPTKPHLNCHCTINAKLDVCTLESSRTERVYTGESEEVVGYVGPGDSTEVTSQKKRSNQTKTTGGVTGGGGSFSTEETESREETNTMKQTFKHDSNVSSSTQKVVNVYKNYHVFVFESWNCVIHGTFGEVKEHDESELVSQYKTSA